MLDRKTNIRRFVAAVALLGVGFGTFEPAFGLVRDGAIHHEGVGEAAQHATSQHGEHGHEHVAESESDAHGPSHQHGTSVDHCTHMHGPAVATPASAFSIPIECRGVTRLVQTIHEQENPDPLVHPPKL